MWRPSWPCPALAILGQQRHGGGDPTYRLDGGAAWRGIRTPTGAATLRVEVLRAESSPVVRATAWGPGSDWALDHVPSMLGADDETSGFEPGHPLVAEGWRRRPHHRFGASQRVLEALVPAIIEQKVTGQEAFAGYRRLVHRYGERAPGPGHDLRLWLQPDAETLRRVPSWEWLRMHIDPARSRAIVRAATVADSLERLTEDDADAKLRSLPGIGEWTSAEVRSRVFGDADAVSFGDYHIAQDIGWALTGTPYDDEEMRGFLEPWRPHRNRVVVLIHAWRGAARDTAPGWRRAPTSRCARASLGSRPDGRRW